MFPLLDAGTDRQKAQECFSRTFPQQTLRQPPDASLEARILLVDDDPAMRRRLVRDLGELDALVQCAANGEQALAMMGPATAVVLLDLGLPDRDGLECLRLLRQTHPQTQFVVLTASDRVRDAVEATRAGAFEYLTKPYTQATLVRHVERGLQIWRAWRAQLSAHGNAQAGTVPAAGIGPREVSHAIDRISQLDATVLIGGESGTGKSTMARLIHQLGPRSKKPFVVVNCASLPRELIESELFGHAKGAFTGAVRDRAGRAESANGGTLFLDEIGDLPLELQPKLLTFLQDRTIQRIGANETCQLDVRLIVATHRNLAEMCALKQFRQDLYYRLNVLRIEMPPLRERAAEIPEIAAGILRAIADRQGGPPLALADDALQSLINYSWPGNIREMENLLERAAAFCDGQCVVKSDLHLLHDGGPLRPVEGDDSAAGGEGAGEPSLAGRTMEEIERLALMQTLRACGGNKARTARMLGISEKSVYNKMRRLDLGPSPRTGSSLKKPHACLSNSADTYESL